MNSTFTSHHTTTPTKRKSVEQLSQKMVDDFISGEIPVFSALKETDYAEKLLNICRHELSDFDHLVVFGTGGAALGGMTLCQTMPLKTTKKVSFCPNLDCDELNTIFSHSLLKTAFLIVSKSGHTIETICQAAMARQKLDEQNLSAQTHMFFLTTPQSSPLYDMAQELNATNFPCDPSISGRYTCFTLVSMLPAAFMGFDVKAYLAAAKNTLSALRDGAYTERFCQITDILDQKSKSVYVVMTYAQSLTYLIDWYSQLWAESVGKSGHGSIIAKAFGPMDQHSQLQLYLDGPKDKFYTFINQQDRSCFEIQEKFLPSTYKRALKNRSITDVTKAQFDATLSTVAENNPSRTCVIKALDANYLGQIMSEFILETILACRYLDINPFNQPAVEQIKQLTIAALNSNQTEKV